MSDRSPPRTGRLDTAGMVIAGIVGGLLVAWFTGDRFLNSESSAGIIALESTLLTVVVAVALWLTHNRNWRAFAAGLTGSWFALVAGFGMLVAFSDDEAPGLPDGAGTPGYFLGDSVDGLSASQPYPVAELDATGVEIGYSRICSDDIGGCEFDVVVSTYPMTPKYVAMGNCERLASVMGVPAVRYGDDELLLFTGQVMVYIADRRDNGRGDELPLASRLRPLDVGTAAASLPPPSSRTQSFVDDVCGAEVAN